MKVEDINAVITGGSSGLGMATAKLIIEKLGKVTIFDTQDRKIICLSKKRRWFMPVFIN